MPSTTSTLPLALELSVPPAPILPTASSVTILTTTSAQCATMDISSMILESVRFAMPTARHAGAKTSALAVLLAGLSRRDRLRASAELVSAHAPLARTIPDTAHPVWLGLLNSGGNAETTLELASNSCSAWTPQSSSTTSMPLPARSCRSSMLSA